MIGTAARRFLIVEDEVFIAIMLEDMISELGHEVVCVAHSVEAAKAFIHADPNAVDAAILDINLDGTRSHDVANALDACGIPFIIATGYDGSHFPEFRNRVFVDKPILTSQLGQAVRQLKPRQTEPA